MVKKIKHQFILIFIKIITLNYSLIRSLIKKWAPKGNITVLDLGCGLGNLSQLFRSKGYLGVDLDKESIELAKKHYPKYSFEQGSITSFRTSRKFDLILVIGVFHHINDKQMNEGLDTISRHLNKKGKAIIIEAIPPIYKWNVFGQIIRFLDQGHFIRPFNQYKLKVSKKLKIIHSEAKKGGIVDYGIFICAKKDN